MTVDSSFAEQIRAKYPEGLTAIFAVGGTRTNYILEKHASKDGDPGSIDDFQDYASHAKAKYQYLISSFIELGGQNMIIPTLAYQRFSEYGQEYTEYISQYSLELIDTEMLDFYKANHVDPYFIGIDTLLKLPESNPGHQLGVSLTQFQKSYDYSDEHYKLIWEIAPVPLFTVFNARHTLGETSWQQMESEIQATDDLQAVRDITYQYYSLAVFGTNIPYPHFYVGSNRNGDLKLRAMKPFSLYSGEDFRMFFLPYPSLFMTKDTLKVIVKDLAFGERMRSFNKDYAGRYDDALVQQEYQRIMELSSNPMTTLGLTRQVKSVHES